MKHNFTAGPAIFPLEVLEELAGGILDFEGGGLSILEVSHRGKEFKKILDESLALLQDLLGYKDEYEAVFLYGGATVMFSLLPMNLLLPGDKAGFINTGVWSQKAIKAATYYADPVILASSEEDGFSYIPQEYAEPDGLRYLHITSNNTIYGSQYHHYPHTKAPLIADMSSDIFSRRFNLHQFGAIYAAAQKNLGPSGTTLLILRKDLLAQCRRDLPEIFSFQKHIENGSLLNTPPVFSIYGCYATLKWIKRTGFDQIEAANEAKARLFYAELDSNPAFKGVIKESRDRSRMNATFRAVNQEVAARFDTLCAHNDIVGIKGHRLAGGYRASMYNALPLSSVRILTEVMREAANGL